MTEPGIELKHMEKSERQKKPKTLQGKPVSFVLT